MDQVVVGAVYLSANQVSRCSIGRVRSGLIGHCSFDCLPPMFFFILFLFLFLFFSHQRYTCPLTCCVSGQVGVLVGFSFEDDQHAYIQPLASIELSGIDARRPTLRRYVVTTRNIHNTSALLVLPLP